MHKSISCVYTIDHLCMHNTLVHVVGQGTQGPGTQKSSGPGPGIGPEHAQECGACTRDLVYTQEILLCTQKAHICTTEA